MLRQLLCSFCAVTVLAASGGCTRTDLLSDPASRRLPDIDPAARVNSVDTVIGDMSLENDARLDGIPDFPWATGPRPAAVLMGAAPSGARMHSWWRDDSAVRREYKGTELWTAFVQWFVVFEGVGNGARNVRVETRRARSFYLSKSTGQWKLLGEHPGSEWFRASKSNLTFADGKVDARTNADGSVAIKVPMKAQYAYHGIWPLGKIDIARVVGDMGALFTTVQARLVVDDPSLPDDRSQAVLLMQSGADYYPNTKASAKDAVPPGAGLSRSKRITSSWQSFSFATLDVARQDYHGAPASISADVFRSNPPPLD